MKDSLDQLLESTVRDWASARPVHVEVRPESRGGPQVIVINPLNERSLSVRLWVADDSEHVACSIGQGSWWDRAVALQPEPILQLLEAVRAGEAWEEIQCIGQRVVARRACIRLPSKQLGYRWLFSFPWITWRRQPHEAY